MDIVTSVTVNEKTETELLNFLLNHALENNLPVAVWRLADSPEKHLIISNKHRSLEKDTIIEDLEPGFMFAPFDRDKAALFLPADFLFTFQHNHLAPALTPKEQASAAWLAEKIQTKTYLHTPKIKQPAGNLESSSNDYITLVKQCMAEIEKGIFEKAVPSRTRHIDLPEQFDIIDAFEKLCSRYNSALISFVSIPGAGSWLGATPEALVSVEDKTTFRTVALAGTLPFQEGMNLHAIAWTQKEIEEQALVERYVISCFKKLRIREYEEHGPKTVVAGNVVHLKSDFTVDMKSINFPQLGTVMLQLLHPTSAVCGTPLESSLKFLKAYEGYDREFYAGYLGPVQINNNIHLYVNLRCMKLWKRVAKLYAGAGVTFYSVPEKEWEETEMKFNTLLNVLA